MEANYKGELFKKLENNRQQIFDSLINYLKKEGIQYIAAGEKSGGINIVEISLPVGKTYTLTCEVVKKEKEYVNLFKTAELIRVPNDYPKTALAEVYSMAIYNNSDDESDFLNTTKLLRKAQLQRIVPQLTTEIHDFATDYVYALKQLASDNLEQMYSLDSVEKFLAIDGYKKTTGFVWQSGIGEDVYVPEMYGDYFSGKQIKSQFPPEMFDRFIQFTNKYLLS